MICNPVLLSRFPVGSSQRRIFGSLTSARAMATRCCCPPESWGGPVCAHVPVNAYLFEKEVGPAGGVPFLVL